jgi:hypothetical protein
MIYKQDFPFRSLLKNMGEAQYLHYKQCENFQEDGCCSFENSVVAAHTNNENKKEADNNSDTTNDSDYNLLFDLSIVI